MQSFQQTREVSQGFKAELLELIPNNLGIDVYVTKAAEKGEGRVFGRAPSQSPAVTCRGLQGT